MDENKRSFLWQKFRVGIVTALVSLTDCGCSQSHNVRASAAAAPVPVRSAENRIQIDGKVNDHPIKLVLDTGAEHSVLSRLAAQKLGLKITASDPQMPIPAGNARFDRTEECSLDLGQSPQTCTFWVMDLPSYIQHDFDGLVGWPAVSNQVIHLDVSNKNCMFSNAPPSNLKGWTKWKFVPNARVLVVESVNLQEKARIGIDSGSSEGIWLSSNKWDRWRAAHVGQSRSIQAKYLVVDGLAIQEVFRARKITLGNLMLSDVPVSAVSHSLEMLFDHSDAVLGLYALRQLQIIIDGSKGNLYTRPVDSPKGQYEYNRLGAVFTPKDPPTSDDLVADVVEDSAAYHAGIRDGDILLKIGDLDVTKWRTDARIFPLYRFWSQPAGTRVKLALARENARIETEVTLKELSPVD